MHPGDDLPDPRPEYQPVSFEAGSPTIGRSSGRCKYPFVFYRGVLMVGEEGDAYPDPRRAPAQVLSKNEGISMYCCTNCVCVYFF